MTEKEQDEIDLKPFLKDLKEIFTGKKYAPYWWTLTFIMIGIIITVKTLDFIYPPSVCFCDCDFNEGLKLCLIDGQKALIKRWGALENCADVCKSEGKTLIRETSYEEYAKAVRECNSFIWNFTDGGKFI